MVTNFMFVLATSRGMFFLFLARPKWLRYSANMIKVFQHYWYEKFTN